MKVIKKFHPPHRQTNKSPCIQNLSQRWQRLQLKQDGISFSRQKFWPFDLAASSKYRAQPFSNSSNCLSKAFPHPSVMRLLSYLLLSSKVD